MTENFIVNQVLVPFLIGIGSSAIVVLFGVRSLKAYIKDRDRKKLNEKLGAFWRCPSSSRVFHVVYGASRTERTNEPDPLVRYSITYGVSQIINSLNLIYGQSAVVKHHILRSTDRIDPSIFDDHVIILGGEISIMQFGDISRALSVPYYQYELDLENRKLITHRSISPKEELSSTLENGALVSDIGTVTRLVNPKGSNLVVLFNGNYGAGLLGSILFVTHNDLIPDGLKRSAIAQQLVVGIPNIIGNMIDIRHKLVCVRPWRTFPFMETDFSKAVTTLPPMESRNGKLT